MSDLISRDALFAEIQRYLDRYGRGDTASVFGLIEDVTDILVAANAVDAAPVVHARWVHEQRYGDSGGWVWRCTACRGEAISPIISALHYCHHCGVKMDGGDTDEQAD